MPNFESWNFYLRIFLNIYNILLIMFYIYYEIYIIFIFIVEYYDKIDSQFLIFIYFTNEITLILFQLD